MVVALDDVVDLGAFTVASRRVGGGLAFVVCAGGYFGAAVLPVWWEPMCAGGCFPAHRAPLSCRLVGG